MSVRQHFDGCVCPECLQAEIAELRASFELRYDCDMRAIRMWHEAGGDELTWPDHADLCVWLMDELARLREKSSRADQEMIRAGIAMRAAAAEILRLREKLRTAGIP